MNKKLIHNKIIKLRQEQHKLETLWKRAKDIATKYDDKIWKRQSQIDTLEKQLHENT